MSKLTIGFFNDSFYPIIDGVITVMDNYAKRLSKNYGISKKIIYNKIVEMGKEK